MIHNRFEFRASLLLACLFLCFHSSRLSVQDSLKRILFVCFYELVTKRKKTSKTITCENVKEKKKKVSIHSNFFCLRQQ